MEKIIKKILEEAFAPIIALLTEIRDQHKAPPSPLFPNTAPLPAGIPPEAFNPLAAPAAPVTDTGAARKALGESLMALAKDGAAGMEKAQGVLASFGAKLLNDVKVADYPALAAAIAAASVKPAAATDMFA